MTVAAFRSRTVRRAAVAVAGAALVAGTAATAHAAPTTRADNGDTGEELTVFRPDGTPRGAWSGTIFTVVDGAQYSAMCVELSATYPVGTHAVDLTPRDMGDAGNRAAAWIVNHATPVRWTAPATGPSAADAHSAAVAAVAVWALTGNVRTTNPTNDAGVNAEVTSLVARARAATGTRAFVALAASPPAAGATSADVAVTGRPGARVDLTTGAGDGSLSAASVTLDASGAATVRLTRMAPGTSTVSATTEGDGVLMDMRTTAFTSQRQVIARTDVVRASTQMTFTAPNVLTTPAGPATPLPPAPPSSATGGPPPVTTPAPSALPVAVTAARPGSARLRLVKRGPARAVAGERLNYLLFVTNTGTAAARNVRVADVLPAGLTAAPGSRGRVAKGGVQWTIGSLAPGATRRIVVPVRAAAGLSGRRVNTATASAPGVAKVTARAATVFSVRTNAVVMPAVTG